LEIFSLRTSAKHGSQEGFLPRLCQLSSTSGITQCGDFGRTHHKADNLLNKVGMDIKGEHQRLGIAKKKARMKGPQVHRNTLGCPMVL